MRNAVWGACETLASPVAMSKHVHAEHECEPVLSLRAFCPVDAVVPCANCAQIAWCAVCHVVCVPLKVETTQSCACTHSPSALSNLRCNTTTSPWLHCSCPAAAGGQQGRQIWARGCPLPLPLSLWVGRARASYGGNQGSSQLQSERGASRVCVRCSGGSAVVLCPTLAVQGMRCL